MARKNKKKRRLLRGTFLIGAGAGLIAAVRKKASAESGPPSFQEAATKPAEPPTAEPPVEQQTPVEGAGSEPEALEDAEPAGDGETEE